MSRCGARRSWVGPALGCAWLALAPATRIAKATRSVGLISAEYDHHQRGQTGYGRRSPHRHTNHAHAAIVGGSPTAIGQAPWQVAVKVVLPGGEGSLLCGGSIIDSAHILTAAHCVFDPKAGNVIPAEDFAVRASTSDLASPGFEEQERAITDVRPHPYYVYAPDSGRAGPDDVAVLTLQEPLVLGPAAAVIPLVSPGASPAESSPVNLTGFGEENPLTNELTEELYSLPMTVGWPRECGGENDAVFLCASSVSGAPCNGDSGGALTLGSPAVQVGVEDDLNLVDGKRCVAGAESGFA